MTMACSGDSQSGLGGTRGHWGAPGGWETHKEGVPQGLQGCPRDGVAPKMRYLGDPESVLEIECPQNWGVSVPRWGTLGQG